MAEIARAIVIHGERDLRIEDRNVEMPGHGQVRVRIERGGICGSDLHYFLHGGFGPVRLREPMILGHEVAGVIDSLGDSVSGLSVGQRVAVSPSRPCGKCRFCRHALFNHCLNMRFYGSAMPFPHVQGAFRDLLIVDAGQCVPADGLSPGEAAMAEPLSVALHATCQAGPLLGRSVLVSGCGPIGILCILAARRAGADQIVATDLLGYPLQMAEQAGADQALIAGDAALKDFEVEKGQFDVHFECSGALQAVRAAIPLIRPRGVIVQLGLGGDMNLPVQAMTAKELSFVGSFRFHEEFGTAVSLMKKRLIDVSPYITQTFAIADAVEAFEKASDRAGGIKTQLSFA